MSAPLVSFVLPAYKREYFEQAIESILRQTYTTFEVVVVDDASPENLYSVIEKFNDGRIHYYRNVENVGGENLVANWNIAFSKAMGEYCVLASDDDYYAPSFLEKLVELAEAHAEADIFHCRLGIIDAFGNVTKISEKRPEYEHCVDMIYARGIRRCLQVAPEFLFRREALVQLGGFINFPLAWYSDEATWYSLAKRGGVFYVDEVLFFWRYSGCNISSITTKCREKVEAAERYKQWVMKFLNDLECGNDMLDEVRQLCRREIVEAINAQTLFDLSDTSFGGWLRIMFSNGLSLRLKLRSIKSRVLQLCRF